ncbi:hypothetical protein [Pedobacter sp. SYSU D00535]|uniref:hypothetical protein n=1 Tax=Pedobacter sp. SYSU D00535 TaxID=2810308 RepID=UPI001A9566EA|nr:hypothetical protein [Pedobacter sp. SYSU D00535]
MRTSLKDIKTVEEYLFGHLDGGDAALLEAKLLLSGDLSEQVKAQQQSYILIREFGRKELRKEIEEVHQNLFSEKQHRSFRQKILRLFIRK